MTCSTIAWARCAAGGEHRAGLLVNTHALRRSAALPDLGSRAAASKLGSAPNGGFTAALVRFR
jgi:hypothetical protein